MKAYYKCKINYINSPHLTQIYHGFKILKEKGLVSLEFTNEAKNNLPILEVIVNNRIKVIYDTLDGLNWKKGTEEENLEYFNMSFNADFYFKRSYNQKIKFNAPKNCKVFPLGLNYMINSRGEYPISFKEKIKNFSKEYLHYTAMFEKKLFQQEDFEFYPLRNKNNKILFLTRLWNPDDVSSLRVKNDRKEINEKRIKCIEKCKNEFGNSFIGGLKKDDYSIKNGHNLLAPFRTTKKSFFLKLIKDCNICISTTGLHNSTGWKFAEYVAASRAIISEPLLYELPGNFKKEQNYLSFENNNDLIENIYKLLDDKGKMQQMMNLNYQYYNSYLRPDMLILNTLIKITESA